MPLPLSLQVGQVSKQVLVVPCEVVLWNVTWSDLDASVRNGSVGFGWLLRGEFYVTTSRQCTSSSQQVLLLQLLHSVCSERNV